MLHDAAERAIVAAAAEFALDLVALRRRVAGRTLAAAHAVQWTGVLAVAFSGMEPRGTTSAAWFAAAWCVGLVAGCVLLARGAGASSRGVVAAKLALHGAVVAAVALAAS